MWKSIVKRMIGAQPRRGVIRAWARWDDEAHVWYVIKCDIPGVAAEADSLEELGKAVMAMVEDLQEDSNDSNRRGSEHRVPVELLSRFGNHAHY